MCESQPARKTGGWQPQVDQGGATHRERHPEETRERAPDVRRRKANDIGSPVRRALAPRLSIPKSSRCATRHQKRPERRQHALKAVAGAAGTEVISPELLMELLVAVDDAHSALDPGLGRVAASPLSGRLERKTDCRSCAGLWCTSGRNLGREEMKSENTRRLREAGHEQKSPTNHSTARRIARPVSLPARSGPSGTSGQDSV